MKEQPKPPRYRRIGAGACGTVWAPSERGPAYKREDGGLARSLRNDYEKHQRILHSLNNLPSSEIQPRIHVPRCYTFIQPTDESWWTEHLPRFPEGYSPCNVIHAQRIPPFPKATRERLIAEYCPSELRAEILASETNEDCLVRPYLGRRRTQAHQHQPARASRFKAFSLRNYPLHVDQMEELGIPDQDMGGYAEVMAETLAIMHWVVRVDANDVEFVLAPADSDGDLEKGRWENVLSGHAMWMLDFDLCRDMAMDKAGVEQAVAAFWKNDPFYPRPEEGSFLWLAFREMYLGTSQRVVGDGHGPGDRRLELAKLFVDSLEEGPHSQ
ncbi:hypothetical protein CDV55_106806 [Aspergillus turcosus]|uniref:DUF3669 domain-containing protein n=1 Tax=Aspergillus turcosus TaxID=1245748 RepID=A0A229Z0P0_9EURO|nr:hypothetical protein CDV55_106806 [Aspergillus turcosus]RLL96605.1 hypothetical protein CFD26_103749 [Aspergillus turcosus]